MAHIASSVYHPTAHNHSAAASRRRVALQEEGTVAEIPLSSVTAAALWSGLLWVP